MCTLLILQVCKCPANECISIYNLLIGLFYVFVLDSFFFFNLLAYLVEGGAEGEQVSVIRKIF